MQKYKQVKIYTQLQHSERTVMVGIGFGFLKLFGVSFSHES